MPLRRVKGGWTFGGAVYPTRAKALRAYQAYLAQKFRGYVDDIIKRWNERNEEEDK